MISIAAFHVHTFAVNSKFSLPWSINVKLIKTDAKRQQRSGSITSASREVIIRLRRRMKHEVHVRIIVRNPPRGVSLRVQRGKDELLPPFEAGDGSIGFEFPIDIDV